MTWELIEGDALDALRGMPDASVDSVVTDPPYGINFMGKGWDGPDGIAFRPDLWREALRVSKPGGHLLAFGGTRMSHRLAVAIEDAGWEIRDTIQWIYGTGFPKSLDVSKALDKAAGAERTEGARVWRGGQRSSGILGQNHGTQELLKHDTPATDLAAQWQGWGTALKPAHEPIIVARKPLQGTVAANVARWGTGAINVDGCRVPGVPPSVPHPEGGTGAIYGFANGEGRSGEMSTPHAAGRWPSNLLFSHAEGCELVGTKRVRSNGQKTAGVARPPGLLFSYFSQDGEHYGDADGTETVEAWDCRPECPVAGLDRQSPGSPRFFPTFIYQPKASRRERTAGVPSHLAGHPTVKSITLMRWLCRLVTPPGGVVLDMFGGSGSTGVAAIAEGMRPIVVEREAEYAAIARARLAHAEAEAGQP